MQKPLHNILTMKWVDDFCDRFELTTRIRTGNKSLSPAETAKNNKYVAYHLEVLKRAYDDGLDLRTVENYDETHMILDLDNGRVLDFKGKKRVAYLDVSSGRDGFTGFMRLSGGQASKIERPLVIFRNPNSSYPILGIPDNLDSVMYRSSPNG
eukprot:IDg1684t1